MKTRSYVLIALLAFVVAVTGSDLFARMTIAGDGFQRAIEEHLDWVSLTLVGLVVLFAPFGGAALICGRANRHAMTRSTVAIFSAALMLLGYFYFEGFQSAQHALIERKWTAAALSVGLLPFFPGIPVLAAIALAAALVSKFDRRIA